MNITKLLLASVATIGFVGASAAPTATGFYAGGRLGMANTNVKTSLNNTNDLASQFSQYPYNSTVPAPAPTTAQTQPGSAATNNTVPALQNNIATKVNGGSLNALFDIFAGYGYQFNGSGYVGAELNFGLDTTKVTPLDDSATNPTNTTYGIATGYGKVTVKRTAFYGLAIRGGFFVTPSTLLFVKVGIEGGAFKVKSDLSGEQLMPLGGNLFTQGAAVSTSANNVSSTAIAGYYNTQQAINNTQAAAVKTQNKNAVNFLAGLGSDIFLNKNLFVRFEWNYLFGPSVKIQQYAESIGQGTTLYTTTKISQNQFKFGVGYKF